VLHYVTVMLLRSSRFRHVGVTETYVNCRSGAMFYIQFQENPSLGSGNTEHSVVTSVCLPSRTITIRVTESVVKQASQTSYLFVPCRLLSLATVLCSTSNWVRRRSSRTATLAVSYGDVTQRAARRRRNARNPVIKTRPNNAMQVRPSNCSDHNLISFAQQTRATPNYASVAQPLSLAP
jgi:hypothetical protein